MHREVGRLINEPDKPAANHKSNHMKTRLIAYLAMILIVATTKSFAQAKKPNILVIFGDDIGQTNLSAYSFGLMGYRTPNIDRLLRLS